MRSPVGWLPDYGAQYLAVFGLIASLRILKAIIFHIVWTIKTYTPVWYRPHNYIQSFGEWAAVTGCTAGIGLSLTKEIAQRGVNIVLISRSQQKLSSLAKQLESKYKIKTKIIVNDAVCRKSTATMAKELAALKIGILVNNVAINFEEDGIKTFDEMSHEWIYNMMTVNIGNAVMTMKHVLPNMISARRGIVVNMCSSSSYTPAPKQALYSGTKVYLDVLSRALGHETNSMGVAFQSLCPFLVQSNMTLNVSSFVHRMMCISGDSYAKSVVDKIGTCKRSGGIFVFDLLIGICLLLLNPTAFVYMLKISMDIISKYLK